MLALQCSVQASWLESYSKRVHAGRALQQTSEYVSEAASAENPWKHLNAHLISENGGVPTSVSGGRLCITVTSH